MDEAAYKEFSKEKHKTSEKNPIVTLSGTTGQRVLNNIFVVLISGCFGFYGQEYSR